MKGWDTEYRYFFIGGSISLDSDITISFHSKCLSPEELIRQCRGIAKYIKSLDLDKLERWTTYAGDKSIFEGGLSYDSINEDFEYNIRIKCFVIEHTKYITDMKKEVFDKYANIYRLYSRPENRTTTVKVVQTKESRYIPHTCMYADSEDILKIEKYTNNYEDILKIFKMKEISEEIYNPETVNALCNLLDSYLIITEIEFKHTKKHWNDYAINTLAFIHFHYPEIDNCNYNGEILKFFESRDDNDKITKLRKEIGAINSKVNEEREKWMKNHRKQEELREQEKLRKIAEQKRKKEESKQVSMNNKDIVSKIKLAMSKNVEDSIIVYKDKNWLGIVRVDKNRTIKIYAEHITKNSDKVYELTNLYNGYYAIPYSKDINVKKCLSYKLSSTLKTIIKDNELCKYIQLIYNPSHPEFQ